MAVTAKGFLDKHRVATLSGPGVPVDGAVGTGTGAGKAPPGSIYIDTTSGASRIYRNEGTLASPVWSLIGRTLFVPSLGRNGAGALTLAGTKVGDKVVLAYNLTDLTDSAAGFEATITVAGQIQQSSATDFSAKKHLFCVQR
jgi:hypothetical protein